MSPQPQHPGDEPPHKRTPITGLRNNLITGVVVIAPISLTLWVIWTAIGWIDGWVLPFVPSSYRPQNLLGLDVPGFGVIIFVVFAVLVGWMAKGFIGSTFIRWGERLVDQMPVVRSIYNAVKQIAETVFSKSETTFDRACLVQYPRPGIWAIAFISSSAKGEIASRIPREDRMISVFLPTTPNPTSGFLLFVPEADVLPLSMSVEDAAKLVISAGLVYPSPGHPGEVVPAADLPSARGTPQPPPAVG